VNITREKIKGYLCDIKSHITGNQRPESSQDSGSKRSKHKEEGSREGGTDKKKDKDREEAKLGSW
jgi:hypothetical protein